MKRNASEVVREAARLNEVQVQLRLERGKLMREEVLLREKVRGVRNMRETLISFYNVFSPEAGGDSLAPHTLYPHSPSPHSQAPAVRSPSFLLLCPLLCSFFLPRSLCFCVFLCVCVWGGGGGVTGSYIRRVCRQRRQSLRIDLI